MRLFILLLFGTGVLLAFSCGIILLMKNSKIESMRKQLQERGVNTNAFVVGKEFKKTRRIIHVTGRLQNFDSFLLKLKFNSKAKSNKGESSISFNKALAGEESVGNLTANFVNVSKEVGQEYYDSVEKGDAVPVIFLPDSPEQFEVLENDGKFATNYLFWFAIGCFIFSLVSSTLFMQYYRTGTTM